MFFPSNSQYIAAAGIPVAVQTRYPLELSLNVYVMSGTVKILTAAAYSNGKEKA